MGVCKIMAKDKDGVIWKRLPQNHDYDAAYDYLTLHMSHKKATKAVDALRIATLTHRKAKDILRASRLPLLPQHNIHVRQNIDKIKNGEKLSPCLFVSGMPLIIADGYHRVCSIYYLSEDLIIPCKLI